MGFEREFWRTGAAIVLWATAAVSAAEPAEPLTVTQLADPESNLQILTAPSNIDGPDGGIHDFSRAISEAVRTQQQSIEGRCQSANKGTGPIAARWAWEARCHYRRY